MDCLDNHAQFLALACEKFGNEVGREVLDTILGVWCKTILAHEEINRKALMSIEEYVAECLTHSSSVDPQELRRIVTSAMRKGTPNGIH